MLWAGAICLRLVYLQIFRYGDFEQRAQRQQQRTTEVAAKRGIIYDRAGRELAMSISVDSVFAVPSRNSRPGRDHLADHPHHQGRSPRTAGQMPALATFCWVARKADAETTDRIRAMNLRGIYFQKESKRFYPKRELAAQVLGYVGMDDEGLSGIERDYDDELRGKPGRMLISVDARRKWFGSVEKQPEPGENVVLTIDEKIQYIAERELETAMQQTHAESGHGGRARIPQTGEILALANRPTFNPNLARRHHAAKTERPRRQRRLRAGIDLQASHDCGRAGRKIDPSRRTVRLPDGIDRHQRHAHSRQQAARAALRRRRAGRIERRGRDQDRAAPGRRSLLQIHSRLWFRTADRH